MKVASQRSMVPIPKSDAFFLPALAFKVKEKSKRLGKARK
jgi:hypothetical protein